MLSAIRRRMRVSPATVVAGLALVFAMTGGAYAAKKYLITSTKQISPSVLKSLQGKAGAAGANGVQGAAGPAGPAGPQGAAGAAGAKGDAGAVGKDGSAGAAGLAGATGPKGETGPKGSNGAAGAPGATGPTGPAGPTCPGGECLLPEGATETGVWSFTAKGPTKVKVSASFPLKLSAAPEGFHYLTGAEQLTEAAASEGCPGSFEEPKADPETLCIYENTSTSLFNAKPPPAFPGVALTTSGFVVQFPTETPAEEASGTGTWAVAR